MRPAKARKEAASRRPFRTPHSGSRGSRDEAFREHTQTMVQTAVLFMAMKMRQSSGYMW